MAVLVTMAVPVIMPMPMAVIVPVRVAMSGGHGFRNDRPDLPVAVQQPGLKFLGAVFHEKGEMSVFGNGQTKTGVRLGQRQDVERLPGSQGVAGSQRRFRPGKPGFRRILRRFQRGRGSAAGRNHHQLHGGVRPLAQVQNIRPRGQLEHAAPFEARIRPLAPFRRQVDSPAGVHHVELGVGNAPEQSVHPGLHVFPGVDEQIGFVNPGHVPRGGIVAVGFHSRRQQERRLHPISADVTGPVVQRKQGRDHLQRGAGSRRRFGAGKSQRQNHKNPDGKKPLPALRMLHENLPHG